MTMAAIGTIASVFAIYNQLEQCGNRLHQSKYNFRVAKEEVTLLADEVSVSDCQSLSGIFTHISRPLEMRVMQLAREQQLEKISNSQATFASGQIEGNVLKLEPLKKDAKLLVLTSSLQDSDSI